MPCVVHGRMCSPLWRFFCSCILLGRAGSDWRPTKPTNRCRTHCGTHIENLHCVVRTTYFAFILTIASYLFLLLLCIVQLIVEPSVCKQGEFMNKSNIVHSRCMCCLPSTRVSLSYSIFLISPSLYPSLLCSHSRYFTTSLLHCNVLHLLHDDSESEVLPPVCGCQRRTHHRQWHRAPRL